MPTRNELKELAKLRLKEAETLFEAELYDGAVYLCGYVIEFALQEFVNYWTRMNIRPLENLNLFMPFMTLNNSFYYRD